MKKKILALCLVICLAATAIIGGTLAYFTDDEQATNTMTIGNVQINIEENVKVQNEDNEWVYDKFEDNKFTLYPVDSNTVFADLNAHYNKVVRTFNTSESQADAYIRTIVLIEKNDFLPADYANQGSCCVDGLHFGYFDSKNTATTVDGKISHGAKCEYVKDAEGNNLVVNIGNEQYWVVVFTAANEEAIPYDEALHTLNSVWMDKNITSEQIAGWGTDNKVDIIVFSQGIQSYDLTHAEAMEALGTIDQANLTKWIDGADAVINDWVPVD